VLAAVRVGVDLVLDLGEQFGLLEVVDLLEPDAGA
jgi:hypothetical protein